MRIWKPYISAACNNLSRELPLWFFYESTHFAAPYKSGVGAPTLRLYLSIRGKLFGFSRFLCFLLLESYCLVIVCFDKITAIRINLSSTLESFFGNIIQRTSWNPSDFYEELLTLFFFFVHNLVSVRQSFDYFCEAFKSI